MSAAVIAEERAAERRAQIAARLRGGGGIDVEVRGDGVVASGKRLKARWLRDAGLRWIGGWS